MRKTGRSISRDAFYVIPFDLCRCHCGTCDRISGSGLSLLRRNTEKEDIQEERAVPLTADPSRALCVPLRWGGIGGSRGGYPGVELITTKISISTSSVNT
jgi:hypothetical protein